MASINESDVPFGARLWSTISLHSGTNSFFFQAPESKIKIQGLLETLSESLQSKAPSRFICVIPKQEILPSQFLDLVTFNIPSPLFVSPGSFVSASSTMSIVLAMNKESMLIDPINYELFKSRLLNLSKDWPPGLFSINEHSNALFSERTPLFHPPRTLSKHPINVLLQSCSTINFFDAFTPKKARTPTSLPPRAANLIGQMNRQPRFLGVLGILPNQLRTLLKETGHENREEALLDLSRTLFFAGYRVWKKRQQLATRYWKEGERQQKGIS